VVWPEFSKAYAEQLGKNGIHAQSFLGLGMGHNPNDKEAQVITQKPSTPF